MEDSQEAQIEAGPTETRQELYVDVKAGLKRSREEDTPIEPEIEGSHRCYCKFSASILSVTSVPNKSGKSSKLVWTSFQ